MSSSDIGPQEPGPHQVGVFLAKEQKYQGESPDVFVWGDSRAAGQGAGFLHRAGYESPANMGNPGLQVSGLLWELGMTALDMTHARAAVLELGVNDERYTEESPREIFRGVVHVAGILGREIAGGGHVYVTQIYACLPGAPHFDPDANAWINDHLQARAEQDGRFVFVPVELDPSDYRDRVHLNAQGEAKVQAAELAAMQAHGDAPNAPEQLVGLAHDGIIADGWSMTI